MVRILLDIYMVFINFIISVHISHTFLMYGFLFSRFRVKVYQSNVVRSDLHPVWKDATLDLEAVCNGDLDRAMKIILWDHRSSTKARIDRVARPIFSDVRLHCKPVALPVLSDYQSDFSAT